MARYWLSPVISGGGISVTFTQVAAAASPRYLHRRCLILIIMYYLVRVHGTCYLILVSSNEKTKEPVGHYLYLYLMEPISLSSTSSVPSSSTTQVFSFYPLTSGFQEGVVLMRTCQGSSSRSRSLSSVSVPPLTALTAAPCSADIHRVYVISSRHLFLRQIFRCQD